MVTISGVVAPPPTIVGRRRAATPPVLVRLGRRTAAWDLVAALFAVAVASLLVAPLGIAAPVLIAVWVLTLRLVGRSSALSDRQHGATDVLRAIGAVAIGQWLLTASLDLSVTSTAVLVFTASAAAGSVLSRTVAAPLSRSDHDRPRRTLLVGDADHVGTALHELEEVSGGRLVPVAGCRPDELMTALGTVTPDIVIALPGAELSGRVLQRVTWELESRSIPLAISSGLTDVAPSRTTVTRAGALGLVEVRPSTRHGLRAGTKAAWERCAAAVALLVLAPVLLALALLIRIDTKGPAIFRQVRVGRHGRTFTMLKFRSMRCDAEALLVDLEQHNEVNDVLFKMKHDPRVTRVGRILRKLSLDELPQLANVALGHMALVGPRPALPAEVAEYDQDPHRRLVVKPGLTGLWQVSGRSDLSWEESVRLDLDYVDNWSIWRDLAIVGRTFHAVLARRGAY